MEEYFRPRPVTNKRNVSLTVSPGPRRYSRHHQNMADKKCARDCFWAWEFVRVDDLGYTVTFGEQGVIVVAASYASASFLPDIGEIHVD